MEIPKYNNPIWLERIMKIDPSSPDFVYDGVTFVYDDDFNPDTTLNRLHICYPFIDNPTLILKNEKTNEIINVLMDRLACKEWRTPADGNNYEWHVSRHDGSVEVYYDATDEKKLPIIEIRGETYEIILDINPEWKLQLAKIKLSFAMSLIPRLVENSLLDNYPLDIIVSIGENIETAVGDRTLIEDYAKEIKEYEMLDKELEEIHIHEDIQALIKDLENFDAERERGGQVGSGRIRKIKSKKRKSKRKKTKRRKTKRKKTKRRKRS